MSIPMPDNLKYDASGLIPTVVQDFASGDILMVAFANAEAVRLTGETAIAHFWSRSRGKLWKKGESSGNVLRVREVRTDCDRDCLLVVADPAGPTCHTNARTCFGETTATAAGAAAALDAVISARAAARPAGSYTARLQRAARTASASWPRQRIWSITSPWCSSSVACRWLRCSRSSSGGERNADAALELRAI